MYSPELKQRYESDGYFVVDDAVEPAMFLELLAATRRVREKVLAGEVDIYTHRSEHGEPWAIRGLFAPEFDEPVFAEYLMSPRIMSYVRPFLGDELRLGGVLIFTNPDKFDYGTGWHRDLGKEGREATGEAEMALLNRPLASFKWHLALVDDSCLQLVPGSHRRNRTDLEHHVLIDAPNDELPEQRTMALKAGQTLFWSGNTIHRGVYPPGVERLTVVGVWNRHRPDEPPQETDPRLKWMLADNVRPFLPEPMRLHYDRWRALQLG